MKNWKTSIAGGCTILGSILTFAGHWFSSGQPPSADQWSLLGAGLTVGAGLIAAADGKTVSKIDAKVEDHMDKL